VRRNHSQIENSSRVHNNFLWLRLPNFVASSLRRTLERFVPQFIKCFAALLFTGYLRLFIRIGLRSAQTVYTL